MSTYTATRLNRANTVHAAGVGDNGDITCTPCGAEGRYGFATYYRKTSDAVTCKRCLKIMAARQEATPAPAPAPAKRELTAMYIPSRRTVSLGRNPEVVRVLAPVPGF